MMAKIKCGIPRKFDRSAPKKAWKLEKATLKKEQSNLSCAPAAAASCQETGSPAPT